MRYALNYRSFVLVRSCYHKMKKLFISFLVSLLAVANVFGAKVTSAINCSCNDPNYIVHPPPDLTHKFLQTVGFTDDTDLINDHLERRIESTYLS